MLPQCYEREAMEDIGVMWEIDQEGCIWRISKRYYNPHTGRIYILPCRRKRAEYQMANGYLSIQTYVDGRRVGLSAHRLVWQYFFGNIPDDREINHKNGDKADNHPSNLEVVTKAENAQHAVKLGLIVRPSQLGERNHNAKLTLKQVEEIRMRHANGENTLDLAKAYPVGRNQIYHIISNHAWRTGDELS